MEIRVGTHLEAFLGCHAGVKSIAVGDMNLEPSTFQRPKWSILDHAQPLRARDNGIALCKGRIDMRSVLGRCSREGRQHMAGGNRHRTSDRGGE